MPRRPMPRPRDWAREPDTFGHSGQAYWRSLPETAGVEVAAMRQAAQFQHWIAASIRADHPEQSFRDLAATTPGLSYVQLHES